MVQIPQEIPDRPLVRVVNGDLIGSAEPERSAEPEKGPSSLAEPVITAAPVEPEARLQAASATTTPAGPAEPVAAKLAETSVRTPAEPPAATTVEAPTAEAAEPAKAEPAEIPATVEAPTAEPAIEAKYTAPAEPSAIIPAEAEAPAADSEAPTAETPSIEAEPPVASSADPEPLPRRRTPPGKTSPSKQGPSKRGRKSLKQVAAEAELIEIPADEVLFSKQYYTMGEVSEMFRVNQSLLRFWETEFDILQPKKNKKGDRYFRPVDIKNLHLIYHLLRQKKYTIEGAKEFLKKNSKAEERFEVIQRLQQIKAFLVEWKAQL